jgi:Domain of unknown function (DUF4375)
MKPWLSISLILAGLLVALVVYRWISRRPTGGADYDWKQDPQVWAYHRKQIDRIHQELGKSPQEILANNPGLDPEKFLGTVGLLCSWKSLNGANLTPFEHFLALSEGMGMEVTSGGFHQYFTNSTADEWPVMLVGMQMAGDSEGVARFEKVLSRFPGRKPSTNRWERNDQLDALGDAQYELFEDDDEAFYEKPFPDWNLIHAFIVKNINQFEPWEEGGGKKK